MVAVAVWLWGGGDVIAEAFVWKQVQFYDEVIACLWLVLLAL